MTLTQLKKVIGLLASFSDWLPNLKSEAISNFLNFGTKSRVMVVLT